MSINVLNTSEQLALRNLFAMCLHLNSNKFKVTYLIDCHRELEIIVETQQTESVFFKKTFFKLEFSTGQCLNKIDKIKQGIQQLYDNTII